MSSTSNAISGGPSDRQRGRGARSTPGAAPPRGDRLPAPPRQRRPALAALAVLLIVGGAALAGLLSVRVDHRTEVLAARDTIPFGAKITATSFKKVRLTSADIPTIPGDQLESLVGQTTTRTILKNTLIDETSVTLNPVVTSTTVGVGVPLTPGRVPAKGLVAGDRVAVYLTPKSAEGASKIIAEDVVVSQTTLKSSKGGGLAGDSKEATMSDGNQSATLMVGSAEILAVVNAAAKNEISLVLLSRDGLSKPLVSDQKTPTNKEPKS